MPDYASWSKAFDDRLPIYRQIILELSRAFVRGDIGPGERIPSIREMSVLLQVNTNTVQRVYQEMERSGLIGSRRGTGYFFTEEEGMVDIVKRELAQDSLRRFMQEMRALGCSDNEILDEIRFFMTGGETDEPAT